MLGYTRLRQSGAVSLLSDGLIGPRDELLTLCLPPLPLLTRPEEGGRVSRERRMLLSADRKGFGDDGLAAIVRVSRRSGEDDDVRRALSDAVRVRLRAETCGTGGTFSASLQLVDPDPERDEGLGRLERDARRLRGDIVDVRWAGWGAGEVAGDSEKIGTDPGPGDHDIG